MDELIQKFEELRLAVLQQEETADTIMQSVQALNSYFLSFQEQWSTLEDDEQLAGREGFLRTQANFHFVGSTMLDQVQAAQQAVQMPPAPLMTHEQTAAIGQLRFGEPMLEELPPAGANNNGENVSATERAESEMCVDADGKKMEVDSNNQQTNTVNAGQLASAVNKACEQQQQIQRQIMELSFEKYTMFLKPLTQLQIHGSIDVKMISAVINGIIKVMDNIKARKLQLSPDVVRTIVLLILTKLDDASLMAWSYFIGSQEPTFDMLVSFLQKRQKDKDVKEASNAAVGSYRIPHVNQPPPCQPSTSQQAEAKPKNKKGAAARARSKSVTPTAKKPKGNGDGGRCKICNGNHKVRDCQRFFNMSLEDREAALRRNNLCINCFSSAHTVEMCMDRPCPDCNKRHNSMLLHRFTKQ